MSTEMFRYHEALSLLRDSWGVESVEERLRSDRKCLLDQIVTVIQEKTLFQTISVIAQSPDHVERPSFDEIKQRCLSGVGGTCYSINVFTWCLLKAIGFSAMLSCATVGVGDLVTPNTHVVVLLKNVLKSHDKYLVDCGCGYPTFQAVSLNFEKESPVYGESFIKCKYVWHNKMILRLHLRESSNALALKEMYGKSRVFDSWKQFYSFIPEANELEETLHSSYSTRITKLQLTQTPLAMLFPSRKVLMVMGDRLMIEKDGGDLETTVLGSDEEIVKTYRVHFPQLKEDSVGEALDRWRAMRSDPKTT